MSANYNKMTTAPSTQPRCHDVHSSNSNNNNNSNNSTPAIPSNHEPVNTTTRGRIAAALAASPTTWTTTPTNELLPEPGQYQWLQRTCQHRPQCWCHRVQQRMGECQQEHEWWTHHSTGTMPTNNDTTNTLTPPHCQIQQKGKHPREHQCIKTYTW